MSEIVKVEETRRGRRRKWHPAQVRSGDAIGWIKQAIGRGERARN